MADYANHQGILTLLKKAQEAETDVREKAREVRRFLNEPDGQWEDRVAHTFKDRPRYTFDRCNDLVDDIAGEMEQADFDIRVNPAGGEATKELAETYDGLIRNIENISNAVDVFNAAGRCMVGSGFDAWRVVQRWGDNNTFDQDLFIDPISDAIDRVWFDPNSSLQTREDAEYCFVLQSMVKEAYEEKFPDGSGRSVSTDSSDYSERTPEVVMVGEILYKTREKVRIVQMSNNAVYVDDDKFQRIQDELANQGVTVKRERMREMVRVKTRIFDGDGWLTKQQDTVFSYLPVIPTYGNWSVSHSVPCYWGIVTKKMDAQRVYNYTESRKVEEGALAPLEKIVATTDQVGAHKRQWEDLNVSNDPALFYEHQEGQPPPFKIGGAQVNPSLEITSQSMLQNLQSTAGLDQLNGQPLGLQSGVAVELKQNKGDTRNYKYTVSQEKAICHTAKILVDAIPKVYDTKRQVRIIGEGKTHSMVTLNDEVYDEQTRQTVMLNNLSQGVYDVVCDVGPAFKNRQSETVNAFKEIAELDPSILQEGQDIWFGNMNAPGFDKVAERVRLRMVLSGVIPENQLTDDEREMLANQPEPAPDPVEQALLAEAEREEDKVELQGIEAARKDRELQHKIDQDSMNTALEEIKTMSKTLSEQVAALKALAESGAAPGLLIEQGRVVSEAQAEQP